MQGMHVSSLRVCMQCMYLVLHGTVVRWYTGGTDRGESGAERRARMNTTFDRRASNESYRICILLTILINKFIQYFNALLLYNNN